MKSGQISSALVTFDYVEVKVANTQFKAMVRDLKYDFGELAIVTFLQAKAYHKPYVLLPATIVGRNQHHTIFYNADKRRRIVDASACSVSRIKLSHAITALWSAWRNSSGVVILSVRMKCCTSSR